MLDLNERALELHKRFKGKLEVKSRVPLKTREDLSLAYTPGVAEPCRKIAEDKEKVFDYTNKWNAVAVVTDGTAVLGLGDIGPEAGLPVMEGKALLFKEFAGVDAYPICLKTKNVSEIVKTIELLEPGFGGINLEDISAPRCFEIEEALDKSLGIPFFHDDQHGTAIVVLAALENGLKVVGKEFSEITIVLNGVGAAGTAVSKALLSKGVGDLILCGRNGVLTLENASNDYQKNLLPLVNKSRKKGLLPEALVGADVFIGVSAPNLLTARDISRMSNDAIVFAMANPVPEIMPEEAKKGGARVVGSGRSDYPNQINNVLAFPGVFRGALDARAKRITREMKLAAAKALAECVSKPSEEKIVPDALDRSVAARVAEAVRKKS